MNILSHAKEKSQATCLGRLLYKQPIQKQARYVVWNG